MLRRKSLLSRPVVKLHGCKWSGFSAQKGGGYCIILSRGLTQWKGRLRQTYAGWNAVGEVTGLKALFHFYRWDSSCVSQVNKPSFTCRNYEWFLSSTKTLSQISSLGTEFLFPKQVIFLTRPFALPCFVLHSDFTWDCGTQGARLPRREPISSFLV